MSKGGSIMEKEMICIGCPLGCNLIVKVDGEEILVSGNTCPNGEKYAKEEISNPARIITSTVEVKNGELTRVSCKSQRAIPKDKIFDVMKEIRKKEVVAPVKIGDILIENVCDTDINIIATKNIKKEV